MRLWRKRQRFARYEPPDGFTPPPIETLVEEGELIALAGVRLRVKNRIILHTVRDGDGFDLDRGVELVRAELDSLARESSDDARRLGGRIDSQERDTRRDDSSRYEPERLPRRKAMLTMLAERLDALAEDEALLRQLAASARDAALDDLVAGRVLATARRPVAPGSPEAAQRAEALDDLTADLDALAAALTRNRSGRRR